MEAAKPNEVGKSFIRRTVQIQAEGSGKDGLLLAAAGCCWSRGETAEPRSGARALRPFDFPEEPGVGKNPVAFEEESETQSSSPL